MFVIDHTRDGKVKQVFTAPNGSETISAITKSLQGGFFLISESNINPSEEYIDGGKIVPRPTMPLSIMDNRIFNVPVGAKLRIAEQTFEINDTVAEISGYHGTIKITCWPYRDAEVEI